ncbi:putative dna replication regulator sld2 protein [Diplogelasinospora grovesii]|uniref:DNA replication regulator SLD2 n=1 Tax=Diplogelasinospora grovesii TaxID=303347 RepID=A0AAN6N9T2_9PEZI|nr:putative dna replication regulator sld2 protein [Diplogelasinospora grovesii]
MEDQQKATYETQSQTLRAELKKWEADWANSHDGKKPGRDDIKANPDIAQKYKQYNRCRDILSGKLPPPQQPPAAPSSPSNESTKRKRTQDVFQTPSKRYRPTTTPQKSRPVASTPSKHPQPPQSPTTPSFVTPSLNRKLFLSPSLPTSIGPTPQRDGRVLGLFDLLGRTPSKPTSSTDDSIPTAIRPVDARTTTPSKPRSTPDLSRTPMSASKRAMLDTFLAVTTTPSHRHQQNGGGGNRTPSSTSSKKFATPAFLRRTTAPLPPVDENGEWKVEPIRLPKKPLTRGLSSVVRDLRKLEDEQLDEELDLLNELENEGYEPKPIQPIKLAATQPTVQDRDGRSPGGHGLDRGGGGGVEVEDSQHQNQQRQKDERDVPAVLLLGGFDDEGLYDSPNEDKSAGLDRNGQPLRVFKKKGQKRTTRLVKMRPTRAKRPTIQQEDDDDGDDDDGIVPETQLDATKEVQSDPLDIQSDRDEDDLLSGSEFDDGEEEKEEDEDTKKTAKKAPKRVVVVPKGKGTNKGKGKQEKGGQRTGEQGEDEKEGVVKRAVRKVKATAHANFKRLKLRQNGAKGGPGHNSRFRRRR